MNCPYCNSSEKRNSGFLKDGTRRYVCKNCGKGFSAKTIIREKLDKECPFCNSKEIRRSGKNKNGGQRYICRACGRKFSDSNEHVNLNYFDKECPVCHHNKVKKGGKSGDGKQYYICVKCKHKFKEDSVFTHITDKERYEIFRKYNEGKTKIELAEEYKVSVKTIYNNIRKCIAYVEPFQKPSISNIPEKTINLIKFYGIKLRVPVDYLSEYLHVSIPAVEYILNQS